ncbi:hypothetical protein [Actinomadura gamaensis]|uniref:SMI1/KNR4 family protein n=1 Tax=Actinomadura gamaensis TaxID=1763541 RepID=A0ABV9U0T5_9ACTN
MHELALQLDRPGSPEEFTVVLPSPGREDLAALQALEREGAPPALLEMYSSLVEASLLDLHYGFRIDPAETVLAGMRGDKPTRLTGARDDAIVVFGTDGGGSFFAVSRTTSVVYQLTGGAWIRDTYDADEGHAQIFASDPSDFLKHLEALLKDEVEANRT